MVTCLLGSSERSQAAVGAARLYRPWQWHEAQLATLAQVRPGRLLSVWGPPACRAGGSRDLPGLCNLGGADAPFYSRTAVRPETV